MLNFKLSKATLKTLASFHNIKTVSADVLPVFETMIIEFVSEIVSKSLVFANKRTIPVKRLYIEDVQNACSTIFKRKPLTLTENSNMSLELRHKMTTDVVEKWKRIMKPENSDSAFTLQLHYSSFHKLVENVMRECGFEIQIGSSALELIQNETEYFLYAVLKQCKTDMAKKRVETLSTKMFRCM